MIQSAKSLLTACCSGFSLDVRYGRSRNEISELAEDFSTYRCVKQTHLPKNTRKSDYYDNDSGCDMVDLTLRAPMYLLSSASGESSSGAEWSDHGTLSDRHNSASEKTNGTDANSMDWIYPTQKLLKSSVNYHVLYLGYRECEQPSGQLAVNESNLILCCELDRSSRVVLRINAKNIKILHPQTDKTLRSFKINMVSFAAQDENTESVFSFITLEGRRQICHSFLCSSVRHAERILMALGQAFEVAFQLRNSSLTPRTNILRSPPSSLSGCSLSGSIPRSGTTCSSIRTSSATYANAPTLPTNQKTSYFYA